MAFLYTDIEKNLVTLPLLKCSPQNALSSALFLASLGHRLVDAHDLHPSVAAAHRGMHLCQKTLAPSLSQSH